MHRSVALWNLGPLLVRELSVCRESVAFTTDMSGTKPLDQRLPRLRSAHQTSRMNFENRQADQLGHADPALTLRVYAHALPEEDSDLSFADYSVAERLYPAPGSEDDGHDPRNFPKTLAPPGGLEPPTHGLGNRRSIL